MKIGGKIMIPMLSSFCRFDLGSLSSLGKPKTGLHRLLTLQKAEPIAVWSRIGSVTKTELITLFMSTKLPFYDFGIYLLFS